MALGFQRFCVDQRFNDIDESLMESINSILNEKTYKII